MFCDVQKSYLLILANLQSSKRQNEETLRFSHQHFAYMCPSKREFSIPTKNLENCSHFLASLIVV